MADDTYYLDDIDGYTNHGVIRVVYKTSNSVFLEDDIAYNHAMDHTNSFNILTCTTCFSAVLADNVDAHNAWHNSGGTP